MTCWKLEKRTVYQNASKLHSTKLMKLQRLNYSNIDMYFEYIQQCNKIRWELFGGRQLGNSCCQYATNETLPKLLPIKGHFYEVYFSLTLISLFLCDPLRMQTILLSNTFDLTSAQIWFSVRQETRDQLYNWRNKGYIVRKKQLFSNCGAHSTFKKYPCGLQQYTHEYIYMHTADRPGKTSFWTTHN